MDINEAISIVLDYGQNCNLYNKMDRIYIQNRFLRIFNLHDFNYLNSNTNFDNALKFLFEYKYTDLKLEKSIEEYDIFIAYIMDQMMELPSQINDKFNNLYKVDKKNATDYFYKLSKDSKYIRIDRLKENICVKTKVNKFDLELTINLSKPEKDPKAIAKARNSITSSYPLCAICLEQEGFYGSLGKAPRSNHRVVRLSLNNQDWFMQYSPYGYFNEHMILINNKHIPMKINKDTFINLYEFVKKFPHYFIGSNADLPIVGGSILSHEHYQGGSYQFPINNAKSLYEFSIKGFSSKCQILDWPLSVIRIRGNDGNDLCSLANYIYESWKTYDDENSYIISNDGVEHNTITPIARFVNGSYEMDLVLRNNITTNEHPLGLYHPHEELWHIKKENIGLIEVMGLAILPGRLKKELYEIKKLLLKKSYDSSLIISHQDWVNSLKNKYSINESNVDKILLNEISISFEECLNCCGVFKNDSKGLTNFKKFISRL